MHEPTTITLESGATLVGERMSGVRSVGFRWLIPAGTAREPENSLGLSAMWTELLFRGAGDLDSRAQADAFDRLGVSRGAGAEGRWEALSATMLGDRVGEALPLIVDSALRPRMEGESVEASRDLAMQTLQGLEDDPQGRVMEELRARHEPAPLNRSSYGTREGIESATRERLRERWAELAAPKGSILAVAGDVDTERVAARLDELFQGWRGASEEIAFDEASAARGVHHVSDETNQVHIAVRHDAPREADEASVLERVVIGTLSGGMAGRLFTEVREKRSLVYSVNARYAAGREFGRVTAYAGTTPERAQETLDVLVGELRRINEGVTAEEFARVRTGLKARLVMRNESTGARAGALAGDLHALGRARTLTEIGDEIDRVTLERVNDYLATRELGRMTIVTLGPTALSAPE